MINNDDRNLYSISDLAEQVGVPRTTITDWLGKYARFMEQQTQGRRRFYTSRTLAVLCKIAELRSAGRSIGDIDGELEKVFAVHPTVMPPESEPAAPEAQIPDSADGQTQAAGRNPPPASAYPVVKQENFDELYDLLGSKFSDLCDAMNSVDRKADASARRLRIMLVSAVLIIVLLAGMLVLFYTFSLIQKANTSTGKDAISAISSLSSDSAGRDSALQSGVNGLSGSVSDLNSELQKLKVDLPAQREAFEAAIREMRTSSTNTLAAQKEQFEAKIALEKELFAAERLKLLQEIESLQDRLRKAEASEPARTAELNKLRQDLADQIERGRDIEKLRKNLADLSARSESLQKQNAALSNDLSSAKKEAENAETARVKAEADAAKAKAEAETAKAEAAARQKPANPDQQG